MLKRNWTHDETVLAFALYCRTQFGQIDKNNPNVIALAKLIDRTPSSVAMKMCNLARCDPAQRERGISGLANGSKLEPQVFEEYANDWESLALEEQRLRAELSGRSIEQTLAADNNIELDDLPEGEYREALVKERIGQEFFREAVLTAYKSQCCVTGLSEPQLLVASHIKPWAACDVKKERLNPGNGLCLNSLHDKAFDRGLITVDHNYKIIISKHIKDAEMDDKTRSWFMSYEGRCIDLPSKFLPSKEFLEYHNDVVFQK